MTRYVTMDEVVCVETWIIDVQVSYKNYFSTYSQQHVPIDLEENILQMKVPYADLR